MTQPSPYSEKTDLDAPIPYRVAKRRVYIAAPLHRRADALDLMVALDAAGHAVVSTWHDLDTSTVEREAKLTPSETQDVAYKCLDEIGQCDALVWLYEDRRDRVGSAVEVGYALACGLFGCGYSIVAYGTTPPPSVFGALCDQASTLDALLALLGAM